MVNVHGMKKMQNVEMVIFPHNVFQTLHTNCALYDNSHLHKYFSSATKVQEDPKYVMWHFFFDSTFKLSLVNKNLLACCKPQQLLPVDH